MSLTRKHLMILVAILGLLSLTACTREITRIEQASPEPSSCFECHSDQNTFMVAIEQQWSNSVHASGLTTIRSSTPSCAGCHSSEGFLDRVAGETPAGYTNPTVIHCFTCHAPHSDGNFDLRVTAPQTLVDGDTSFDIGAGNLCVACHQARGTFATTFNGTSITSTHWGPHHGPQGDLLFGANGYHFAGYTYNETQWHRSDNPDGCVNCHVRFVGSNFLVGGHTFNMAAFLEPEAGIEQPTEIVNIQACVDCHTAAGYPERNFDHNGVQTEIDGLLDDLHVLLEAAGYVDADGHPIGSTTSPNLITEGEAGALWNFVFIEEDRSHGIHNPEYARDLLTSSIEYMEGLTQ